MNINLINFIQEIKSAESNQPQENALDLSFETFAKCSNCKITLNKSLFFILPAKDQPGTPKHLKSKETRIYMCPNPICTSITALESQRKMFKNFYVKNTTASSSTSLNTTILPKQTENTPSQSSSQPSALNFVENNLPSHQFTFCVSSEEEFIDIKSVDSPSSPIDINTNNKNDEDDFIRD